MGLPGTSPSEKYALLSVWDKTGLLPFATGLIELGYKLLSTGGTFEALTKVGLPVISVSDYTRAPEILDGRVKTLHPKIHGGVLARTDNPKDLAELVANEIAPIEIVCVNLYPFVDKVREIEAAGKSTHASLIEFIDIGGPTLLRAAAKNNRFVLPVCDPADYDRVLLALREASLVSEALRQKLAEKVFTTTSAYDGAIARYFSLREQLMNDDGSPKQLAPVEAFVVRAQEMLRYGENPHQAAGFYRRVSSTSSPTVWKKLQGKEISYNNLLDMNAAIDLFVDIHGAFPSRHAAVIIKHLNPCGVAFGGSAKEAFESARACDSISAFGGIVAVSGTVDGALAASIIEGFVEIVVAQQFAAEALEVFGKKKNIRVIEYDLAGLGGRAGVPFLSVRNFHDDFMVQTSDASINSVAGGQVVSSRPVSEAEVSDLELAWRVCKHVKSNAIVIAKQGRAIGIGAGQMSRVDAARIALLRANERGHDVRGGVAASDAFLPFPDTLQILADAGVVALVQPGGSIKDEEVIAEANKRQMGMVITGDRHFRH